MIHNTAEVSPEAIIGENTRIWHHVHIRENALIGNNCILAKGVYIDKNVVVGSNCKIQNNSSIYDGTTLEKGVFIGPHCIITNDKTPRAINIDGTLQNKDDWQSGKVLVKEGASIGARSVILPGITIGKWSMIGAGSVVTKDVPDFALVYGSPATLKGYVCKCGKKLEEGKVAGENCEGCVKE